MMIFYLGSYVFDANQYGDTRLTFDIAVKDFRSQNSRYFRTHPVFMECLQLIFSYMDDKDKKVRLPYYTLMLFIVYDCLKIFFQATVFHDYGYMHKSKMYSSKLTTLKYI